VEKKEGGVEKCAGPKILDVLVLAGNHPAELIMPLLNKVMD